MHKDSMREEDITVEEFACVCMHTYICVFMHCVHLCMSVFCVPAAHVYSFFVCVSDENRQNEGETGRFLLELSGFS